MTSIYLHFRGSLSLIAPTNSVFDPQYESSGGVYLWTIRQRADGSHLIHYIGETNSLARRHQDHLTEVLGLNYGIFDPEKAQEGVCTLLWPGMWRDKSSESNAKRIDAYNLLHEKVMEYLSVVNVFFAEYETDRETRRLIESAIGWNLRNKHPEATALYPYDNRIDALSTVKHGELIITADANIRGLDERILF